MHADEYCSQAGRPETYERRQSFEFRHLNVQSSFRGLSRPSRAGQISLEPPGTTCKILSCDRPVTWTQSVYPTGSTKDTTTSIEDQAVKIRQLSSHLDKLYNRSCYISNTSMDYKDVI